MKKQQKHLIISLITIFFFCLANRAKADIKADNIYTYTLSTNVTRTITLTTSSNPPCFYVNGGETEYTHLGNITVSGGGTLNLVFSNTTYITLHGQIKVTNGTLNISSTTSATDQHLLRRDDNKNTMILLDNSTNSAKDCVLTITGLDKETPFVIDGDSGELTIDYNETDGYTITAPTTTYQTNGQIIRINGSTATLTDVVLQNVYSEDGQYGGGIDVNQSSNNVGVNVHLNQCVIKNCRGYENAAAIDLGVSGTSGSTFAMSDCIVTGCFSADGNGIIRTANNSKCSLTMERCTVDGNYNTMASGTTFQTGAICWNTFLQDFSMTDCKVTNNWTKGNGGGIVIMSSATLTNCTITNNSAWGEGGGIMLRTYSNGGGVVGGKSITVTLENTTIKENTARGAGGGIYLIVDRIQNPPGTGGFLTGLTYTLNVNGGSIKENESLSGGGGGIYAQRGGSCNYATEVNVNGNGTYGDAVIQNNNASAAGGGIVLGSNITLNLNGSATNAVKITNNTANPVNLGGGIYKNGTVNVVGKVEINNNTVSSTANNVYIPSGVAYVNIGSAGLECGSKIGITKEAGFSGTPNYTEIARGTPANCTNAFNNRYFFDDKNEYNVYAFSTAQSPYTTGKLYFIETWKNYANSSGVSGPVDNTYTVSSAAGLAYIAQQVNAGTDYAGKTIQLSDDISLSGHYWDPIGENYANCDSGDPITHTFSGTFDGNGHIITNLNNTLPCDDLGLFGYTTGTVKNTMVMSGSLSGGSNEGGIVGRLGSGGEVYNCVSKLTLTGGTNTGSLVGEIASGGSLKNSYAIVSSGNGLAGSNAGTIENCYVRGGATTLVGSGSGTVNYCYTQGGSVSGTNSTFTAATSTFLYRSLDEQVATASGNSYIPTRSNKQLVETLNNWVGSSDKYAKWGRPTTNNINGDYPVLEMPGCNAVATDNGTPDELHYGDINTLLGSYTAATKTIYLYQSAANIIDNTSASAKLYIDPDAAVTQVGDVNAYVGVWLDNTAGVGGAQPSQGGTDAIDWHLFSSALTDLPIGFTYNTSSYTPGYGNTPPKVNFGASKTGYFPINLDDNDTYYSEWDFYSYSEPDYHWVNMKRASNDHWHSDYDHWQIYYNNETTFVSGRGYLVATAQDCFLQAYGTLKKGDGITHPLSYTADIAYTTRNGFNVLGNPYQSYLDFDQFAHTNSDIWKGGVTKSGYIIMDEDQGGYVCYSHGASLNHYGADRYIHPHQGFIVMACETAPTTVTFNENMRSVTGTASFRGDRPNYPLVNLIVTEASGNRDLCTVELGRPDKGGLVKAKGVKAGKGSIYCNHDNEDWAIVFTQPGLSEIGIRFDTPEDDTFTLTWDTENGDFHYLHLIDNKTGSDIDCLTTDEYRFTANADDYKSRFRLVFDYTGIEEPGEDGPSTGSGTFAFQMGDELVVNGEGRLEMIDMLGRVIKTETLNGVQSTTALPATAGVYVLRLTGKDGVRVQKMIVE